MSTVNKKLTNLADEIRVLSGTTEPLGLTEMATNVNDANDEVADQTDLIAQLASALQGKSVPGGGEDVTAETETYTNLLTDLEAAVDALPDAGSGSSGNVETCTVTIDANASCYADVSYTAFSNGDLVGSGVRSGQLSTTPLVLSNVACGTAISVLFSMYPVEGVEVSGSIEEVYTGLSEPYYVYVANGNGAITNLCD